MAEVYLRVSSNPWYLRRREKPFDIKNNKYANGKHNQTQPSTVQKTNFSPHLSLTMSLSYCQHEVNIKLGYNRPDVGWPVFFFCDLVTQARGMIISRPLSFFPSLACIRENHRNGSFIVMLLTNGQSGWIYLTNCSHVKTNRDNLEAESDISFLWRAYVSFQGALAFFSNISKDFLFEG